MRQLRIFAPAFRIRLEVQQVLGIATGIGGRACRQGGLLLGGTSP